MSSDPHQTEAERRMRQACNLIASAYRIYTLRPDETVASVKSAIIEGAENAAADTREDVEKLR